MFWKKFSKRKPKEKGWYITTVEVKGSQRYTMVLYWYPDKGRWIDNIRQNVFDVYDVYGYSNGSTKKIKLNTIQLCDRTDDVIAWKKLPKTYMSGFTNKN